MNIPDLTNQDSVNLHIVTTLGEIKASVVGLQTSQVNFTNKTTQLEADITILQSDVSKQGRRISYMSGIAVGLGAALGIAGKKVLETLGIL